MYLEIKILMSYRYPAYPTFSSANSGVFGDNVVAALEREYIPDPGLNWETVHSWETGIELNTLENKLHFEANYYNKLTKDILTVIQGAQEQVQVLETWVK